MYMACNGNCTFGGWPGPASRLVACSGDVVTYWHGHLVCLFSPTTRKWLRHVSLTGLTFIQSLRIPANLLLWVMFLWGSLSVQATFEGSNYDILAGLTAPVIALGASKNKVIMVLWNCFSLSLLLYFSATSLLAATTPLQQFYAAPGTDSLFRFPFILLPAFLSPAFIFMHLLSLDNGQSIKD